ncbi:MAG: TVP38/TMEM64 family protein [Clostridia bacterium]|nr:TVP38/TMEM64 family protein [Clostridia bacterium]
MKNDVKRSSAMSFTGVMMLILAGVFVGLYIFAASDEIQLWYSKYEEMLLWLDNRVLAIGYNELIVLAIFALFAIKTFIPFATIPALCVLSGMVYDPLPALIINVIGYSIMLVLRYMFGKRFGGGNAYKLLRKNSLSRRLIDYQGNGNPWVLFILRSIPGLPTNPVSQIYGAIGFKFSKYMLISVLSFLPKIFSYTFIGVYVFDPLSLPFFLPIIILLTLSGISILTINLLINRYKKSKSLERM